MVTCGKGSLDAPSASFAAAALAILLAGTTASAQVQYFVVGGQTGGALLGRSVAAVGDVDGDGVPDVAAGSPYAPGAQSQLGGAGRVIVSSGADGSELFTLYGQAAGDYFGTLVTAAGDVNADGHADVAVLAPQTLYPSLDYGRVFVHSGADGSVLHVFEPLAMQQPYTKNVHTIGDANGDGYADLSVYTQLTINPVVVVEIVSGLDFANLYTVVPDPFMKLGVPVAFTDYDLDGCDDFVVAASSTSGSFSQCIEVRSGKTGAILKEISAPTSTFSIVGPIATLGDVDGDGIPEVLTGVLASSNQGGSARVFSIETGQVLFVIPGSGVNTGFGFSKAATGDVDGDGIPDFAVGAPYDDIAGADAGSVTVVSGAGYVIRKLTGSAATDRAGWSIAGPGDLDGDGLGDLFIGAPYAESPLANGGTGTAWSDLDPWTSLGSALAGTGGESVLSATGSLLPDSPLAVTLQDAAPNAPLFAVFGLSAQFTPFKGGTLVPAPDAVFAGLVTDGNGQLVVPETWPADAPLGLTIWFQCWIVDDTGPQGFTASNALKGQAP